MQAELHEVAEVYDTKDSSGVNRWVWETDEALVVHSEQNGGWREHDMKIWQRENCGYEIIRVEMQVN